MEDIKEKTADEMLADEKYQINNDWTNEVITYSKDKENLVSNIHFWKSTKTISKNGDVELVHITMQELQAINKKCKELGWI